MVNLFVSETELTYAAVCISELQQCSQYKYMINADVKGETAIICSLESASRYLDGA
jgi:hypothetical protein